MGGCYDWEIVKASDEIEFKKEYRDLVQNKRYMEGSGGYTGTLAEKWEVEFIGIPLGHNAWTKEAAREHCLDKNDKWGPAFTYYLGDDKWYVGGWCSS